MPAATDWDGTFLLSALAHFNGGEMNINNPPYVLFSLIAFARLPVDAGRVLVLLVALAALALVVAPILARIELPVLERLAQWRLANRVGPMQDRLIAFSIAVTALTLAACVPQFTATPPIPASPSAVSPTSVPPTLTPITFAPTTTASPVFSRVYVMVMENKEFADIVGSTNAPYINSLIAQYGLATNYTTVTHPSEPNYFALFSGSTQGATNDGVYNLDGSNLTDQLETKGKTWRVFAENVPTNCFTGEVGVNGEDGIGFYARKHNPAISFTDISRAPARCANITDFTHFDPAAADYALIVPNLCHDMHDCSVATGDGFLKSFVPKILNSRAWNDSGALFITWDEGTTNVGGGGRVPLLVISSRVAKGVQSSTAHNHYSLVRTIEEAWGLGCLNESCKANTLAEFFPR